MTASTLSIARIKSSIGRFVSGLLVLLIAAMYCSTDTSRKYAFASFRNDSITNSGRSDHTVHLDVVTTFEQTSCAALVGDNSLVSSRGSATMW